jgi:hypothetical protein
MVRPEVARIVKKRLPSLEPCKSERERRRDREKEITRERKNGGRECTFSKQIWSRKGGRHIDQEM